MNPFDVPPARWVSPSLNRVRFAGPAIPPELEGTTAYETLSTPALRARIRKDGAALEIPAELPDRELLAALDSRFLAANPRTRAAAGSIAGDYGRGLAYLLLALHHAALAARPSGDRLRATVRADWQARHWRFWSQIDSAVVGGGLVAGRLGQEMLPAARALLQRDGNGAPPITLELAGRPRELALLGAARYTPPGCRTALAFDFGATAVKRAVVSYRGAQLTRVVHLASSPSPCSEEGGGTLAPSPAGQLQQMADLMAASWHAARDAGFRPEPVFCVAVATYLYRGQPYPQEATSCYGRLGETGHLPALLAERVSRLLGLSVALRLMHDGTAAAAVFAGVPRRVVITLGTAIGHGFPPPARGLRPLAPGIEYSDL